MNYNRVFKELAGLIGGAATGGYTNIDRIRALANGLPKSVLRQFLQTLPEEQKSQFLVVLLGIIPTETTKTPETTAVAMTNMANEALVTVITLGWHIYYDQKSNITARYESAFPGTSWSVISQHGGTIGHGVEPTWFLAHEQVWKVARDFVGQSWRVHKLYRHDYYDYPNGEDE